MAVVIGVLLVAFVAGVFGSMLGVGGGIIMVPVLSLAFGVPIKTAIATSIICVIATSSMAQTTFAARGMTNMRLGMFLEVATTVGALAGGITAVLIDGGILQACFAVLLFYVAWQMSRRRGDVVPVEGPVMPSSYYDPAQGRQVSYGVHGLGAGFALSVVAGNVSGLLGVGGGAFKVPIMNLLMGVPLKATIATSNLMIGVTAATSAAIFYGRGYVDPRWAVPAALGILVGARIGPRFAIHLPARILVLIFEVVLVVFGLLMLLKALGVGV
ncbi:MAG TPA: sulfite exporter TauE/SafE family protein [Thermoleophilia bacterium]|nr:sulfite exporter TauE/SafE family protein [Thermoleophilia bacterium]